MKRKILSLVAIIACLIFIVPTSLLAEEIKNDSGTTKPEKENVRKDKKALSVSEIRSKKEALAEAAGSQKREQAEKSELSAETEKTSRNIGERSPQSLADPHILDLNYYQAEIIAAAVAKDPDNISSKTDAFPETYYSYDSRGNLSQATTFIGQVMADIYYCDGTESADPNFGYYCPKDWIDYIEFDPDGSPQTLYFWYTSDTPNTNYFAEMTNEPDILFYNINTANGTSVEAGDPLYEDDDFSHGAPVMVVDTTQVTGYQEGDPLDSDWSLWLDEFDGSRLSVVHNWNFLGPPTTIFTPSTARSLYRFWSNTKQHHFFTMSKTEKNQVVNLYDDNVWNYEGIANKGFPTQAPDSVPVYRFWSNSKQGHFYTASEAEKNSIIANDHSWNYEGIAWYVPNGMELD
jgi:hypothetical protein